MQSRGKQAVRGRDDSLCFQAKLKPRYMPYSSEMKSSPVWVFKLEQNE